MAELLVIAPSALYASLLGDRETVFSGSSGKDRTLPGVHFFCKTSRMAAFHALSLCHGVAKVVA